MQNTLNVYLGTQNVKVHNVPKTSDKFRGRLDIYYKF
jgi:hypothetical protein